MRLCGRRLQARAQIGFLAVRVKVMQSIGQMSTQASHSMQSCAENTVCTSQFRQRCASRESELVVEAELDFGLRYPSARSTLSRVGTR